MLSVKLELGCWYTSGKGTQFTTFSGVPFVYDCWKVSSSDNEIQDIQTMKYKAAWVDFQGFALVTFECVGQRKS